MPLIIVEREFAEPVEVEDLQERENRFSWCLQAHRVKFLHTYFAADRQRMICVYEAPDAEAVREVSRRASMPYTRIWSATHFAPPPTDDD